LFRPPLSNRNIERYEAGKVTFRYRDGKTKQQRRCSVSSEEFIRCFLQHVLPRGFTRVRHYGCFSPGSAKKLALARSLLEGLQGTATTLETSQAPIDLDRIEHEIDGDDPNEETSKISRRCCPLCKKRTMRSIAEIPRARPGCCAQRAPP
jgi:hypothetical protein